MKKVIAPTIAVTVVLAVVFWRQREDKPAAPADDTTTESAPSTKPVVPREADPLPSSTGPRPPAATPEPEPEISASDRQRAMSAIDNLGFVLRDYSTAMKGNPVGTNAEITAALLGDNPKQLKLELPAGSTLNGASELCDPWGTPWFFHQLSAYKTEIRSAGPDKKMHTGDDVVR